METILRKLGRTTARHPLLTIGAWVLAIVALLGVGQASGGGFVNEFRIPGSDSQRAVDLATKHFPEMGAVSADVTWRAENGTLADPDKAAAVKDVIAAFREQPDVRSADDPLAAQGTRSEDGKTALSAVQYGKPIGELTADAYKRLDKAAEDARKAGVAVEFRGQVPDLASTPETGSSEFIGVFAALLILLVAFGSVVAAGLPVLVALAGLAGGTALVLIAGAGMDIPAIAPIVAVMLGLGAGVDYALFVVTRFRQSLEQGKPKVEAVGEAMATAGHAVLFAGATVVAAILGLLLTGIPFIGGMGVAAALTVAMTLCSALTLLPAVLGLLGHRVNALRVGRRRQATGPAENGFWGRWVDRVVRRRFLFAGGSLVVLALLIVPLFSLRLGTPDDGNSPQDFTQRKAYDTVTEAFGPGSNAQLLLVAQLPDGAQSGNDAVLKRLGSALAKDGEVSSVTPAVLSQDKEVALLTVVPKHGPQDREVSDLLHRIRDDVAPDAADGTGVKVYVGGTTAFVTDLSDAVGKRLPWMVLAVLSVAAVLLIGMFRAPLMALKAALMALLSVGSSIGVLVAVFQWGWGLSLTGMDDTVPIISMVPMLLFAVLFGLSMDYEVFMLSAIKEEYDRSHDPVRALRAGLGSTALVVVAAAAIMAVVFLSFVPISDPSIKMIGVGLAIAVLVDVMIVRLILLPAVMSILGHAAWRGWGRGPQPSAAPLAAPVVAVDRAEVPSDVH
ncbi:MMPL family transporter [Streptomyces canus]|uniref:MMPL family transporter n=1 Tax=Streptomyces canus TaxID=58343 RepID=UPI00368AA527